MELDIIGGSFGSSEETGCKPRHGSLNEATVRATMAGCVLTKESSMPDPGFVHFPDSPFQLYQPYQPAGDQPRAIEELTEGVRDGLMFQTLLGVTGSGKTYTMANTIARLGRPALVLAPNKTLAAQLY